MSSASLDRHHHYSRSHAEDDPGRRSSHHHQYYHDREPERSERDRDRPRDRERGRGREYEREREYAREYEREPPSREQHSSRGRERERDRGHDYREYDRAYDRAYDRDRPRHDRRRSRSREEYQPHRQRSRDYSHPGSHHRSEHYSGSQGRRQGRDKSPIALFDKYSVENLSPFRGITLPLEERQRVLKNWDTAPPGFERISADKAKLTGLFPPPGNIAKITNFVPPTLDPTKAAMLAMLTSAASGDGGPSYLASGAALFAPALSKQARRVYVGNIPTTCTEEEIADHFNQRMEAILPPTTGHYVLGVEIAGDRDYAFVDLRSPDEAQLATALDSSSLKGHTITVRRTREYENATAAIPERQARPLEENQLVLAGLPAFLAEPHLKYLLAPLGQIKFLRILCKEEGGEEEDRQSLGIAVVELEDRSLLAPVCAALKGFQLSAEYPLKAWRLPDCLEDEQVALTLSLFSLTPGRATDDPTPILQLLNMVTVEDLVSEREYEDILEDIRTECAEFGTVRSIVIPRPAKDGARVAGLGKVFVEYSTAEEGMQAAAKLAGRTFADRTVLVSYYPQEKYQRRIF